MLKNYELLYIIHPDLEGSSEKVTEKVAGFIKKASGEITNQEEWGKRKLAYKIAKNDFGVYILVNFSLESGNLPTVEHDLGLSEEIMRSMIVEIPAVKAAKKPRRTKEAKKAKDAEAAKATKEPVKKEVVVEAKSKVSAEPVNEEKSVATKPKTKKAEVKETKEVEKPKKVAKEKAEKPSTEAQDKKKAEAERMKKLDEKLGEILGE